MQVKVIDTEGKVRFCNFEQASRLIKTGVAHVQHLYPYTLSLGDSAKMALDHQPHNHLPERSVRTTTQEDLPCLA